jgi:hypothetical protein
MAGARLRSLDHSAIRMAAKSGPQPKAGATATNPISIRTARIGGSAMMTPTARATPNTAMNSGRTISSKAPTMTPITK